VIQRVPLVEAEYEYTILDYAEGLVRAGNAHPDLAVQVSQQQCAPVLSDGLASPNQFFYTIREDTPEARHVGYLWWGIREQYGTRTAMLYFVGGFGPYRRRGYATQAWSSPRTGPAMGRATCRIPPMTSGTRSRGSGGGWNNWDLPTR